MNKKIIYSIKGLLFVIIIGLFIYIGTRDFSKKDILDNEKFDQEYETVSKDNAFRYVTGAEVYAKFKNENAIIFMGYASNKWCSPYASIITLAAKEMDIKEIMYYDFYNDMKGKNATYQSIVLKLNDYLYDTHDNVKNIYGPMLIVLKNGNIIYADSETAITKGNENPDEYWSEEKILAKKEEFKKIFKEYLE